MQQVQAEIIPTKQVNVTQAPITDECSLVDGYNWNTQIAHAICMAESHGNPDAYNVNTNGTTDAGLMQINSIHTDLISLEDRYNPTLNIEAAYKIYLGDGWKAWSSYNSGKYEEYM